MNNHKLKNMKTKILLFGLFLLSIFCFGQKKGETVTTEWLKHPCFNGIEYKVINYNYKNSDEEAYWGIIVRNGYGAPLSCSYSLKVGGVSWGSGYDNTYELAPGKSYSHSDGGLVTAMNFKSSSTNFTFEVKDVKVGDTKFACENGRQINLTQKEKNDTWQQNQYQSASELVERKNQLCAELGKLINGKSNNIYALCQAQTYGSGDVNKLKHEVKLLEDEIHKLKYEDSSNKGIANQTTTNSSNQQAEQQRQQQEYQRIAEENARRDEEERQKKAQAKQELINISVNAATDLINYFANRKNALRNSLSQEDAQALLAIVNSENPTEYTQNIIQIFTDLGYTHRKTDKKDETTYIFLNNDIQNINDFMMISIHPASKYNDYNSISFSYHRRKKLLEQLSSLGSNLKGFDMPEITGISPSRQNKREENIKKEVNNKLEFEKYVPQKINKVLENNITAKYVVEEHIKTIGGLEKLKLINNITTTTENEKGTSKQIVAHGKILNKGISDGNSYKSVFNGTTGYSEWNGNKIEMDKKMVPQYQKNQPIFILKFHQNPDLELKGVELFRGKECYAVSEKSNINEVSIEHTYFFDTKNFELLGIEYLSIANNYQSKTYLLYDDYRPVDGISFAFKVTSVSQNSTSTNIVKELLINQTLTDKDFE